MTTELNLLPRVAYRGQEIAGPRLRGLLALLAGDLRTGSSAGRLVEGLWPDEQPENPAKALQVLVSRARAQLGADVIASTATGYRLSLREDQVDASAVLVSAAASARSARAGDHASALAHAEAGLALWDGATGGDAGFDDPVSALRAERAPTYRALRRARALALSRLGRHAEALGPLDDLAAERPRDEEVLLELLRCEAATAGPSSALARYEAYRRSLRDELGTDPGAELQALHQQLLQGTAPLVRHGVPHEPNPLLGRDDDIAAVTALLRTARVASIVGPGGLGKTRLAHAVSRQAEQRIVHLVALAGVTGDDDVAGEVAAALGAGESRRTPVGQRAVPTDVLTGIVGALGPGPALLVLDNCEHVLRGAAELVRALVSMTKDLRVLTTSRAPLGLSSESVYLLPELSLPTAVELFGQRAHAARPGAELPAGAVEEVCRHLDGLPLAVELAAARVRVMSVAEIGRRLEDRFALLRGGARDAPERHQTLHAVVDWSWNLLEPAGRAAMRALSVFPGGFTADAARQVLRGGGGGSGGLDSEAGTGAAGGRLEPSGSPPVNQGSGGLESEAGTQAAGDHLEPSGSPPVDKGATDVPRVLEDLVGQSLLQVADTPAGTRFRMLETVREFSAAEREAAGETDQVVGGFLAWARDFGIAHHEAPFGADPFAAVERIRAEQDNLVHALRHALARADGASVAAAVAVLLGLWVVESRWGRMAAVVEEAAPMLSRFRPAPELVEVTRTALVECTLFTFLIEGPRAARSLVALRRLPPAPPDTLVRAAVIVLGAVTAEDPSALQVLCDSDEPLVAGIANSVVSYLRENEGDVGAALKAAERMLEALERRRSAWLSALVQCRIAEMCLQVERGAEARQHLSAALPVLERIGAWSDAVGLRWWLVLASLQAGDVDEAERWVEHTAPHQAEEPVGALTYGLGVRAEILLARGEVEAGLRLWRRAVDLLSNAEGPIFDLDMDPSEEPWVMEAKAVAVVAHAQHDRLDLVAGTAAELPGRLSTMLANPAAKPPPWLVEFPVLGALLLALAMVDLDRGARDGDERATRSGAGLVALAERFRFLRMFQPTMSSARARQAAENADLGHEGLRAAALEALGAHPPR